MAICIQSAHILTSLTVPSFRSISAIRFQLFRGGLLRPARQSLKVRQEKGPSQLVVGQRRFR